MNRWRSLFGGVAAVALLAMTSTATAESINNLGTTFVSTTYMYPDDMGRPGQLTLEDDGLGLIATLGDLSQENFGNVGLTLSLELTNELGDPMDTMAEGMFGPGTTGNGVLSIEDLDASELLFQADIVDFVLAENEFVEGSFTGQGNFENAIYGGGLSDVDQPTDGLFVTSLITWYLDEALSQKINIDNFVDGPGGPGSTIYGESAQVSVVPEPASLLLLSVGGMLLRRRR